jgi:hypothetical protein
MPFKAHFGSSSSPYDPFSKRRTISISTIEDVGKASGILKSTISLHNLPSPSWYLYTHEISKHRFRSQRLGIPKPPNSFFVRKWMFDR